MKTNNIHRKPLEFNLIERSIDGEAEAINCILKYYEPYINQLAMSKYYDEYGNEHFFLDEDVKQLLQIKLITKTLSFKPDKFMQ